MNFLTIGCLLLGFLLGEMGLGLFNAYTIGQLKPFIALALGWVGFIIGENLELATLRRMSPSLVILSLGQLAGTLVLTSWALYIYMAGNLGSGASYALLFALLAGVMATATDPITALARLGKKKLAAGPSHLLAQLTTIADVFTVMVFWGVISWSVTRMTLVTATGGITWHIILHPAIGLLLGMVLSFLITAKWEEREITLLFIAAVFLAAGAAVTLEVSPLIICAFASAFVMSVERSKKLIREAVHNLEKPVYVTFLVLCGALFSPAHLPAMAVPILIYVVARVVGKVAGTFIAARVAALGKGYDRLGLGLLSQAGLTVVLAVNIYLEVDRDLGLDLVALAVAGILINQVLGVFGMQLLESSLEVDGEEEEST
jgi:Kef-type K+ transport system membrane component KefB